MTCDKESYTAKHYHDSAKTRNAAYVHVTTKELLVPFNYCNDSAISHRASVLCENKLQAKTKKLKV